jgi:cytochrome P450
MDDAPAIRDTVRIPDSLVSVILDPSAYADDRIYDAYAWLRANNPVGLVMHPDFDPFWLVTRHEDVQAVSRDNETFHNGDRAFNLYEKKSLERVLEINNGSPHLVKSLVGMDPPEHPKYRALTQAWFMPPNLKKREDEIRQIARRAVERLMAKGERCDFVPDLALNYPLHVIMSIFGVPEADEPIMLKLTQELFGVQDPDLSGEAQVLTAEQYAEFLHRTVAGFTDYFKALSDARRRNPRDDLATLIANAEVDGAPIPLAEEVGYYITVATAGHDTTSTSTAAAMWELAADPDAFARVKADPSLIPTLVDEAIRWAAPIKHFMRSATRDTVIGGRRIAQGDWLMLCYGSANRDEEVFPEPDSFKVDRAPNRHLSFGYGPHLCLGMHLAKMEMRILFEELLPRLKSVSLDGQPVRSQYWFINGPKTLPLKFELA